MHDDKADDDVICALLLLLIMQTKTAAVMNEPKISSSGKLIFSEIFGRNTSKSEPQHSLSSKSTQTDHTCAILFHMESLHDPH